MSQHSDAHAAPASNPNPDGGVSDLKGGRARVLLFVALCAICLTVAVGTMLAAARGRFDAAPQADSIGAAEGLEWLHSQNALLFLSIPRSSGFRTVALGPLDGGDGTDSARYLTDLTCDRVHFAAGQGLCMVGNDGMGETRSYDVHLFDDKLALRHTISSLEGFPSRARVSPDGRYAAMTAFVSGDSYDSELGFSTRTMLLEPASGTTLANLEEFTVTRNGKPFHAIDFNFWGVTFARDSNRFYATLATGDQTYLVEGDVASRSARVLREGVECPSLSPDNTQLAFKKRVGRAQWRLHVLDLETLADKELSQETRSIDDQVEWLDDGHLAYAYGEPLGLPADAYGLWTLPTDGSGPPKLHARGAYSPAVVRPG